MAGTSSLKKIVDFINNYEIILPVPIHKKRLNGRGYNQSELLAREISRKLKNIQFFNKLLIFSTTSQEEGGSSIFGI